MNKKKKDLWNLLFSAFLITAFIICAYFFVGLIKDNFAMNKGMMNLMTALVFAIFGAVLFYATRIGDGKQVWRFSVTTLLVMVLPALYIIVASFATGLPFGEAISGRSELIYLAGVALGYGIPYTFLSGYELDRSEEPAADQQPADGEDHKDPEAPAEEEPEEEIPELSPEDRQDILDQLDKMNAAFDKSSSEQKQD